jgi:hypothetical protein
MVVQLHIRGLHLRVCLSPIDLHLFWMKEIKAAQNGTRGVDVLKRHRRISNETSVMSVNPFDLIRTTIPFT